MDRRGDELVMFFAGDTIKVRNIATNPNVAVLAVDTQHLHGPGVPAYAVMTGSADVGAAERDLPDRLAVSYGAPDGFQWPLREFQTVHVDVTRVAGLGPVKGGRMGGWSTPPSRAGEPTGRGRT